MKIKMKDILTYEEYKFIKDCIGVFKLSLPAEMGRIASTVDYTIDIIKNYGGSIKTINFIREHCEKNLHGVVEDNIFKSLYEYDLELKSESNRYSKLLRLIKKIAEHKSNYRGANKYDFAYFYDKYLDGISKMDYQTYLYTKHWREFRKEAIKFYNNKCQICGKQEEGLNVHHNNYENIGKETFNDVTVLCKKCHAKFHDKE